MVGVSIHKIMKIIVSIQRPKKNTKEEREWSAVVRETNALLKDDVGAVMLNEGTWQIESESGLPLLGSVLHDAEAENLSYRILFADSETEWKRSF